ncbi:MAG: hypothetical protein IKM31_02905 [Oscillospiraceae bacterium]|nr:hypothetical protein [Oscillospiraceae bacterium]
MSKFSRFLSVVLTVGLLWGCGKISDLTYEKAADFEGITFPPVSSSPSGQTFVPSGGTSSQPVSSNPSVSMGTSSGISWGPLDQIDGGYYYENLTSAQQDCYELLLDGFRAHADEVTGLSEDSDDVFPAVSAVYFDHPELPWLQNGGGKLIYGTGTGTYVPEYKAGDGEGSRYAAEAAEAADSFLATVDMAASDYEKVRTVFEYLVDTIDYDGGDENCRDIYGALVEQKAVCAGYAAAAKYLLDRLDVPCMTVTGDTLEGEPHAWNVVWVDGVPYHMDATWGDPSFDSDTVVPDGYRNYHYLLMTTEEIHRRKIIDESVCPVPLCSADDDYYVREGLELQAYPGNIGEIFVNAYLSGESWVTVSFDESVSLADVEYMLFECDEFYDFFDAAGVEIGSISFSTHETANYLTVFF